MGISQWFHRRPGNFSSCLSRCAPNTKSLEREYLQTNIPIRIIVPTIAAARARAILRAIERLEPGESTNTEEGLQIGYLEASRAFIPGAINRVILCSDGVANVGNTGPDSILESIHEYADQGKRLTTVGFGMATTTMYSWNSSPMKGMDSTLRWIHNAKRSASSSTTSLESSAWPGFEAPDVIEVEGLIRRSASFNNP